MRRTNPSGVVPVGLVEQNPLGREFLLRLLEEDSSLQVVRIQDPKGRREQEEPPAVIIVDGCGLPLPLSECLRRLRFHFPDAKYVILDHELPREELLRLLWMKVDGFLPYQEVQRSLLVAVHSVKEGRIWMPREVLRDYVQRGQDLRQKDIPGAEPMTYRENQIIELVKRRLSNKEIGDILRIRESTVKFHLSNIYSKLRVGSRHDLIRNTLDSSASGFLPRIFLPSGSKA